MNRTHHTDAHVLEPYTKNMVEDRGGASSGWPSGLLVGTRLFLSTPEHASARAVSSPLLRYPRSSPIAWRPATIVYFPVTLEDRFISCTQYKPVCCPFFPGSMQVSPLHTQAFPPTKNSLHCGPFQGQEQRSMISITAPDDGVMVSLRHTTPPPF